MTSHTVASLKVALRAAARPEDAQFLLRFFKAGPGEYAEGDQFLGVRVPETRKLVPLTDGLALDDLLVLLSSPLHEERLLALLAMVRRFEQGDAVARKKVMTFYLENTRFVNNWDLVDTSAARLLGAWLLERPRVELRVLTRLARSQNLWERRIAMIATQAFVRAGKLQPAFTMAEALLGDSHDLIHKAAGWMLREAGRKDVEMLREFLGRHAAAMPRTMLRYAIEHLSPSERQQWMSAKRKATARA